MMLLVESPAPAAMKTPSRLFEITLRSAGVVPPIVLLDVLLTYTPEATTPSGCASLPGDRRNCLRLCSRTHSLRSHY